MKKRIYLFLILTVIVVAALSIYRAKDNHVPIYTIAVINYSPAADSALEGMLAGLALYGYHQGENLKIIYSGFIRDKVKLADEAKRLVSLKPDLIYAMSTPAALAAKAATAGTDIPVVFGPVSTPVKAGIVESMKYPGGNITGVTFGPQEPRRLDMLKKIKPELKLVAVPYNPNDKSPRIGVSKLTEIAHGLKIDLLLLEVTSEEELNDKLFASDKPFDAIFVPTDSMMVSLSEKIAEFAIEKKIPYTCPQQEGVYTGALFSYGFSIRDLGTQAARLVHMILSGTKPSEIPVEISDFQITINIGTAEKTGIEIPEYLLSNSFIIRQ